MNVRKDEKKAQPKIEPGTSPNLDYPLTTNGVIPGAIPQQTLDFAAADRK